MKKLFCLMLAMLLIGLAGCGANNQTIIPTSSLGDTAMNNDNINEDPTMNNVDSNDDSAMNNSGSEDDSTAPKYTIYVEASFDAASGSGSTKDNLTNIQFGDITERDFYYARDTEIDNPKACAEKEFVLAGNKYVSAYHETVSNSLSSSANEKLHSFGVYEKYNSEEVNNRFSAKFRQSDGELVLFSRYGIHNVTGDLTEQEAKALADSLMMEKYGEAFASEYPDYSIVVTNENTRKLITVCYTKYIYGYPTTDRVLVTYNMQGELKSLNAVSKGLFNPVQENITEEKINAAKDALISAISTEWDIQAITLLLDSDGGCYLLVYTSRVIEGSDGEPGRIEPMEFYINID